MPKAVKDYFYFIMQEIKENCQEFLAGKKLIKKASFLKNLNEVSFSHLKKKIYKEFSLSGFLSYPFLREIYLSLVKKDEVKKNKKLEELLVKRKIRSLSGIISLTVATKPYPCPGKCIFCPTQKGIPKSYLKGEPAISRALLLKYDPFLQTEKRLLSLEKEGHPQDKVEIIIIGGTFSSLEKSYQEYFVKKIFDALNKKEASSLKEAQRINQTAQRRCVGLTIETRPDFISEKEIIWLRHLGVTQVEIGIQSIFDDILLKNKRGHTVKEVKKATKLLKDAGFKVCYHLMLNLFGSSFRKDLLMFEKVFSDSCFKPDYLKIYPCVVLKGTFLYKLWKEGYFKPYSDKTLKKLLLEIKKRVPFWLRIKRIIRDIPPPYILAGNKVLNLRQILLKENIPCHCIRCREIKDQIPKEKPLLFREDYKASWGREIFLSFEDKKRKHLFAFLRLRIPSQIFEKKSHFLPELENCGIVRDLHTYGPLVEIAQHKKKAFQHKGLGKKLLLKAENILKEEFDIKKIAVIAAVGARNYYQKLGYQKEKEYMVKNLRKILP